MTLGKKFITITIIVLFAAGLSLANKSVFIVSKHLNPSIAQAYKIDSNQVILQGNIDISSYNQGLGAVGCAVWPEKELIFFTFEDSGTIVWSSTKRLQKVGEYRNTITEFAGIAVDRDKQLIYALSREGPSLYVYSYDSVNNILVFQDLYELKDSYGVPIYGWGIALDETNDLLYATTDNVNAKVYVYDTNDFGFHHEIIVSVGGQLRRSVGIALDPNRGYLYTGNWVYHNYLVRTNTSSPYTSTEVSLGGSNASVIGIGVDKDTGYVYCTTHNHDFRVYNSSLQWLYTETNSGISGPAGVAVGGLYKTSEFIIIKDNNDPANNCVHTDDLVTFNINWDANDTADANVVLTDCLPKELDYISSDPCGEYNPSNKTVIWDLNNFSGDEYETFQITAKVNNFACPCGRLTNKAAIESDNYYSESIEDVNVCTFGDGIIYVDKDAKGFDTGTSWQNAYTDLQDALAGSRRCPDFFDAIWVAEGTYKPAKYYNPNIYEVNFALVRSVDLIGHFAGFETSPQQRDMADANFMTILDGQIGSNYIQAVSNVLRTNESENINNVTIDGFTIRGSYAEDNWGNYLGNCIRLENADNISIINCKIRNNYGNGIYSNNSSIFIANCILNDNRFYGINLIDSKQTTIINNWIHHNTEVGINYESWNTFSPIIRNNTICKNNIGIFASFGPDPNIRNCIIRGNFFADLEGWGTLDNVNYCCLTNEHPSGIGNITDDPLFYNADANNYHLTEDSPCIDAGDSNGIPGDEIDIDGENRKIDGDKNGSIIVDIGADEYYHSPADFDNNYDVNFIDYCILANNWLIGGCSAPNWCSGCDIDQSGVVDTDDLKLFCADWLWRPGWLEGWMFQSEGQSMMMQQGEGDSLQKVAEMTEEFEIQQKIILTEEDIKSAVDWLDEIWLDGFLKDGMTEDEYLEFRKTIENSPL